MMDASERQRHRLRYIESEWESLLNVIGAAEVPVSALSKRKMRVLEVSEPALATGHRWSTEG